MRIIQVKVFGVFKSWLEDFYYDIDDGIKEMFLKAMDYIFQNNRTPWIQNFISQINKLIFYNLNKPNAFEDEEKSIKISFLSIATEGSLRALTQSVGNSGSIGSVFDPYQRSPKAIAEQLTLIDFQIFKKITPKEFFGENWQKQNKYEEAPNVMQLINHSNKVSLTRSRIRSQTGSQVRCSLASRSLRRSLRTCYFSLPSLGNWRSSTTTTLCATCFQEYSAPL